MRISLALLATLLLLVSHAEIAEADATRDYAVMVSATVQENPPQISLTWPANSTGSAYYVYRKAQSATDWGPPIAVLDNSATGFTDANVALGGVYEYSLRKSLGFFSDTLQVAAGTQVSFTITDGWGDGICCHHGLGSYEISGCGTTYASGGAFGDVAYDWFVTGTQDDSCTELIVSIQLDFYGTETIWALVDESAGELLAEGGPYDMPRYGHILAGIRAPAIEDRGTVLLVVDEEQRGPLSAELDQLELDMICDGHRVRRIDVSRESHPNAVKQGIVSECDHDSTIDAVLLLGHVPVPYSGDVRSDHGDHRGAWPADVYYGDLDGVWTDSIVTNVTAGRSANHNIPRDGKFDQTYLPSDVDLQVGRVDLFDLQSFPYSETDLLRRYLNKNHAFRSGKVTMERRGVVDDNAGPMYGAAFAATGLRNFSAMFGADNVHEKNYLSSLINGSYLWSYGCGGSTYTDCGGVARSQDFALLAPQTVFTILYGSYFGDWDNRDNILRAPLASEGPILSNLYGGRPTWHLHHMALGETIGYCTRLTQNNNTLYTVGDGSRQIHIALMGDPTLRMHVVQPPSDLRADSVAAGRVRLCWNPPADAVEEYRLYRSNSIRGRFGRIASVPAADTTYEDTSPLLGQNVYMVRALKLETSGSGTYQNLSLGRVDSTSMASIESPEGSVGRIWSQPNPFREESVIRFMLHQPSFVTLRIHDVCGSRVRTLHDGLMGSGEQQYIWDGRGADGRRVPSGVYFLVLAVPGTVFTSALILVR